jgi:predicted transposase/invertase (TIGR01784 family)
MQAGYQRHIVERSLYYAALIIGDQAPRGDWDFSIDKVYSISILDFNIPRSSFGTGEVRHEAMLVNRDTGRLMSDKLMLIYLEMRNFVKTEDELVTRMDKWLYLLRNLGQLTSRPKALQDRIFRKTFTLAKVSEMDTKEYAEYRQSLKDYWDYTSSMRSNYELGVEKGREEGMEKGIEKGRKEGLEEGRLSVAKRLHLKGMPIADVADVTGLPETVIKDYLDT